MAVPLDRMRGRGPFPLWASLKNPDPSPVMIRTPDKPNCTQFYEIPDSSPQNCEGRKNKESLRLCLSQEKAKETGYLNIMWYPGWGSESEKQNSENPDFH